MFGKRKDDFKHRHAEDTGESALEVDDPEFHEALKQLGLNARAALDMPADAAEPVAGKKRRGVLTAGDLASEADEADTSSVPAQDSVSEAQPAADPAARLEKPLADVELPAAEPIETSAAEIDAELRAARAREAEARAAAAEKALAEAQTRLATLTTDLERVRSEATATGVQRDRMGRESSERDAALMASERQIDTLTAESGKLKSELATLTAETGRLHAERAELLKRQAEQEAALGEALEQVESTAAWAESVSADNLRLSQELSAAVQTRSAALAELTQLQQESAAQQEVFESQSAESRTLARLIAERDADLASLRQMLLDLEKQRAEEAASFLAALGS